MQNIADNIQLYDASTDMASAFALWQTTVGREWPIDFTRFKQILSAPNAHHLVAKENGQIIGFVATTQSHNWDAQVGHLLVLLVAPSWQGKGLGNALHEAAFQHFRATGAKIAQLGGLVPRLWCGLPANLPAARAFFSKRGWEFDQPVYDLAQDLRQYTTPPAIYQRTSDQGITLATGRAEDAPEILAFEQREFPNWLQHYEHCTHLGDYHDVLCARNQEGQIVGTLLMYTPQSHETRTDIVWRVLLGYDAGAMGAVGVAPSEQGRGTGIALVARASELLKAGGVRNCYIDWVELTAFYAKLGYAKWRAFFTSLRDLS